MKGLFLVFEGIDGAGKTTQVKKLAGALSQRGYKVEIFRDPGGTPLGEQLRNMLLGFSCIDPSAEALLYAGARAQLMANRIFPSLAAGKIVICDRFSDSTFAYQGFGRSLPLDLLQQVNKLATRGLKPDLTIILDMPVDVMKSRLKGNSDRLEQEASSFFQKVRQGYLVLAREKPGRYIVLDALGSVEKIHRQVLQTVEVLINENVSANNWP